MDVFKRGHLIGLDKMALEQAERLLKFPLTGYDLTDSGEKEMLLIALKNSYVNFARAVLIENELMEEKLEKHSKDYCPDCEMIFYNCLCSHEG